LDYTAYMEFDSWGTQKVFGRFLLKGILRDTKR